MDIPSGTVSISLAIIIEEESSMNFNALHKYDNILQA
ncbi:Uncharacterised protein [Lederbergia lenta]|uniref:Uncharacterized protein n=1 Tax=Lederbergia lenta TaxID=1467 RepID=A0A2X4VTH2_LEDLE|nr:Uncharacterised protein [Lederbergia lenta]